MEAMVRKQVYIEPDQEKALKQLAQDSGLKESELIRRGIDLVLLQDDIHARRLEAFRKTQTLVEQVRDLGYTKCKDEGGWKREDLYDR